MKEKFEDFNFKPATQAIIKQANEIIEEYQADGFDLTLRQLYYQFVSRDIIPNSQKSYSRLGDIINNARLNGDIDWSAIKDRTRKLSKNLHFDDPADAIDNISSWYKINTRENQENYIECWVEKEALVGVVERICRKLDVPFFACRGYVSQTAMYEASKRIYDVQNYDCKRAIILHLGDHDPSGIDMTRDIQERLNDTFEIPVEIKRIALNMPQIEQYNPPPNPAKLTDSRIGNYIRNYGRESWELDALDPKTITKLIKHHVDIYTDIDARNELIALQEHQKDLLLRCSSNWSEVCELLNSNEY